MLDISTDENRGRHSGQYQMWFFLGVAAASFLGGLFTDLFGFRRGLSLGAMLIGGAALLWLVWLPETRPTPRGASQAQPAHVPPAPFPWRAVSGAALPMFVVRFVSWGVLAATTILWLSGLFGDGLRLADRVIPLATLTGAFVALSTTASIGGAPAVGFLSDKLERRWPVVAGAIVLGVAGVWLMSRELATLALLGGCLAPVMGGSVETLVPAILGDRIDPGAPGPGAGPDVHPGRFGQHPGTAGGLGPVACRLAVAGGNLPGQRGLIGRHSAVRPGTGPGRTPAPDWGCRPLLI